MEAWRVASLPEQTQAAITNLRCARDTLLSVVKVAETSKHTALSTVEPCAVRRAACQNRRRSP